MIDERRAARLNADHAAELRLNKEIRKSAAADKRLFLEREMEDGSWSAIRKLRRGAVTKQAIIKDMVGNVVETSDRPNTLASYFEKVQWKITFPTLSPEVAAPIRETLRVPTSDFVMDELRKVLRKMRGRRAGGHDNLLPDFYKVLEENEDAAVELLSLCNHCWNARDIPDCWRVAKVVLLFKKGDSALPENYRPIALLPVGYKVLAALLHQRLLDAGVDAHIMQSQYGFCPRRSKGDALSVVRRMVDAAHQRNTLGLHMVFLDWAKAFDRIKPDALLAALRRFGLPEQFVETIGSIYRNRQFFIHDHTGMSDIHRQCAGIAQGCPLSPFLFILVQSVMFEDIYGRLPLVEEAEYVVTREVLYADDTLLLSSSPENLQALLGAVVEEGAKYGLELNWGKTYQMGISVVPCATRPDGEQIEKKRSVVYLGGLITCDGKATTEVIRRTGEGRAIFRQLQRLWSHANITVERKVAIYQACIVTKVLHSLESLWLLKSDISRIDAFHCSCLRQILRIRPSFYSRVSNETVLGMTSQMRLSCLLQRRQVCLYKQVQALPDNNFLKVIVCHPNGQPIVWSLQRRRGRPRQVWAHSVYKLTIL